MKYKCTKGFQSKSLQVFTYGRIIDRHTYLSLPYDEQGNFIAVADEEDYSRSSDNSTPSFIPAAISSWDSPSNDSSSSYDNSSSYSSNDSSNSTSDSSSSSDYGGGDFGGGGSGSEY